MASKIGTFSRLVKFEHTVFALPFAYAGAFLAARGIPDGRILFWITVAMAAARSAAMGFNRLIDREIDRLNPRTKMREMPRGELGVVEVTIFSLLALVIFGWSAWELNPLAFHLLPVAVLLLIIYPYTKRFTNLCHFFLGAAQFFAPFGGWIAVTGRLELAPVLLGLGVGLWVAGFDILYALMDLNFDRQHGIHSLPADLGIPTALNLARASHILAFFLVLSLMYFLHLGTFYLLGVLITGGLLVYEHILARPGDNSSINVAFFNVNGMISVSFFVFILLQIFWP